MSNKARNLMKRTPTLFRRHLMKHILLLYWDSIVELAKYFIQNYPMMLPAGYPLLRLQKQLPLGAILPLLGCGPGSYKLPTLILFKWPSCPRIPSFESCV
jgi:hypothetical protein